MDELRDGVGGGAFPTRARGEAGRDALLGGYWEGVGGGPRGVPGVRQGPAALEGLCHNDMM